MAEFFTSTNLKFEFSGDLFRNIFTRFHMPLSSFFTLKKMLTVPRTICSHHLKILNLKFKVFHFVPLPRYADVYGAAES
jgi:hypothetical protein